MEDKLNSKLRYNLTCHKCLRIDKDFIPMPAKDGIAVIWCIYCKIVLARFDYGTKSYTEKHPDD